jgi:hypothetical protein
MVPIHLDIIRGLSGHETVNPLHIFITCLHASTSAGISNRPLVGIRRKTSLGLHTEKNPSFVRTI